MAEGSVKKKQPTTRKGRAEVAAKAKHGEELAQVRRDNLAEVHNTHGAMPVGSIRNLGKRIREVTEDGRFIYEVLRDVLLDNTQHASDRITAGKVLLERGWGKVPDIIILEEILNPTNLLREFSTEELKKMLVAAATQEEVVEGEVREVENVSS